MVCSGDIPLITSHWPSKNLSIYPSLQFTHPSTQQTTHPSTNPPTHSPTHPAGNIIFTYFVAVIYHRLSVADQLTTNPSTHSCNPTNNPTNHPPTHPPRLKYYFYMVYCSDLPLFISPWPPKKNPSTHPCNSPNHSNHKLIHHLPTHRIFQC